MKRFGKLGILGATALAVPVSCSTAEDKKAEDRPNIILILADDMGYSDLACYGGEIRTPNLDALASQGLRWSQFYNNARSCPSRAALMTGLYPHQAGMGWMAAANLQTPQYQGYINNNCMTIGEVLSEAGYGTYMTGKWHLSSDRQNQGMVMDNWPNQRGFDHFYGIPGGATNYFKGKMVRDNVQEQTEEGFYSTDAFADTAATYISKHDFDKEPMFLYLAFNAPHWPLHAHPEVIREYEGRYDCGWDVLREERFARQQELGLFGDEAALNARDSKVKAWDELSASEKTDYADRMEIYAAQVDEMDRAIGRVIAALKERGEFENTLIMFLSDNGACAEHISSGKSKALDGSVDTYESYRINWANLSSTPYREYKHYTHEGGIATPLIVSWPNGIDSKFNGTFVREYGYLTDIMATCVDVAGAKYPKKYKGNRITPLEGTSLVPNFKGEDTGRGMTFWEHEANIAVRDGEWKLVMKTGEGNEPDFSKIELYNMSEDPCEMNNLVSVHPERARTMLDAWYGWAEKVGAFPLDTREYGVRQRAWKRIINGDFDNNYAGWNRQSVDDAVKYDIKEVKGNRMAAVTIERTGRKPGESAIKWGFQSPGNETARLGFTCESDRDNIVWLRLEVQKKPEIKPFNQKIELKKGKNVFSFEAVDLDRKEYTLAFYFGESEPGTIILDDIVLDLQGKQ